MNKPFKSLVVVFKKRDGILSAYVWQGGVLGKNLIPRHQLSSVQSAEKVIGFLLSPYTDHIEYDHSEVM
jgi:hypothetical protein